MTHHQLFAAVDSGCDRTTCSAYTTKIRLKMKASVTCWLLVSLLVALFAVEKVDAFAPSHLLVRSAAIGGQQNNPCRHVLKSEPTDSESSEGDEDTKKSLEDKMAGWEASEEEIKASSLGGVVPGRSDAFDVGLYIAFPFMIIGSLLFAFFPFIMDKIDVSSVGPPPTV